MKWNVLPKHCMSRMIGFIRQSKTYERINVTMNYFSNYSIYNWLTPR
jgi:hypothetical protein